METPNIPQLERIGTETESGREFIFLALDDVTDFPQRIQLPSKYSTVLLVGDFANIHSESFKSMVHTLLGVGGVYFCCWGADCEKAHDWVDEEYLREGFDDRSGSVVMTTWHAEESFREFMWFGLYTAVPHEEFLEDWNTVLAVCIGESELAKEVRSVFCNTERFYNEFLDEE